ncbi:MAG: FAD/NAD(P)-binding protein [Blastococcus sp.]
MTVDAEPMVPTPYRVSGRRQETHDSVTLRLEPVDARLPRFRAGQFAMLYAPGVGEVAISMSGDPTSSRATVDHTVRDVGPVSHALHDAAPGDVIGVRGPFGTAWEVEAAAGRDLVLVAGGVGLAPLRPALLTALAHRDAFRRLVLVAGARSPTEFLFADQLRTLAAREDVETHLTVDRPAAGWAGPVGFVTEPLSRLTLDARHTTALLCGPEPMMRFCAAVLIGNRVPAREVRVSLERNMQCGIGHCGHCQLGPLLVCRDGPVVDYARAAPLLSVSEL